MAEFSREELRNLIDEQIPPCVSIYMPYDQPGTMTPLNSIRFKTLLHNAEEQLKALNTDKKDIEAILAPGDALLGDQVYWQEQREGLAVFMSASPSAFRYYPDNSVAIRFPEKEIVANQFHFKPLLPLLFGDGDFFVLALSRQHVGLLKATRDTIHPVELQRVPHNMGEALGVEIPPPEIQGRPMNVGGGEQTGVFGGYDPGEYEKDRILRYFREVDHDLHRVIGDQSAPLVLAGQEYLHPLYREVNTYSHLMDEGIRIDSERLPAAELHKLAWSLIEPGILKKREDAVNRYRQLAAKGLSSNKLADILAAAHFARVDILFVESGKEQFGSYDPGTDRLEVHAESRSGDSDLLDEAATHTVLNGGTVYMLPLEEMPDPIGEVNAIFRY
jgi:hypothetical protein